MGKTILRPNAVPVYGFLSLIHDRAKQSQTSGNTKVLDCGAGGPVPPLAVFRQGGFECHGIDISRERLDMAGAYCSANDLGIDLQLGDMRNIPFPDNFFDYVYEHYSMCHLSKADTAMAVKDMFRVLKPGGLCFLGVISGDTWPRSFFGREEHPGEYTDEGDGTLHSVWTDDETITLTAPWNIVTREKITRYLLETADEISSEEWNDLFPEDTHGYSREDWDKAYPDRDRFIRYAHLYCVLEKPCP